MKHLDLFSGIGGFALATEMVWGTEVEHIFCDNEPFAQAVLKKHWPNSIIYGDIRTFTADSYIERHLHRQSQEQSAEGTHQAQREPVASPRPPALSIDLLTGGFPCQPFSQAGRRRGTEDDRQLWPEMLRITREFKPRWVIGENVGGLVTWNGGLVLEQIHLDLEAEGYEVQAFIIPAVALNAPHRRDRVWIVAHRIDQRHIRRRGNRRANAAGVEANQQAGQNARGAVARRDEESLDTPDASNGRRKKHRTQYEKKSYLGEQGLWSKNWLEIATALCRVDDGLSRRLDRTPRLKSLGNAIVPQVAAEIFKAIKSIDEL